MSILQTHAHILAETFKLLKSLNLHNLWMFELFGVKMQVTCVPSAYWYIKLLLGVSDSPQFEIIMNALISINEKY